MAEENGSGGGSPERVAYDLTKMIMYQRRGTEDYDNKEAILELFIECRRAVIHGKMD